VWLAVWLLASGAAPAAGLFVEAGDVLTANYMGNKVVRISPQTGAQVSLGQFAAPTDLVLTTNGVIYISELPGTIKRLTLSDGNITVVNPATTLTAARGLALGPSGDLFVTGDGDRVLRVNPATGAETLITQGGNLLMPAGIELLDVTNLVVASFQNSTIVKVSLLDNSQTILASGGTYIDRPWGIAVFGTKVYTGHYDSKFINQISALDGSVSHVASVGGFPYGIGVDSNGDIIIGAAAPNVGQQDMLVRLSPQGTALGSFDIGLRQQITGIQVSPIRFGEPPPVNGPPVLTPIGNRSVNEGTLLSFHATATDTNQPPQTFVFSLGPGAPAGASITAAGDFTWTPTEGFGPGSFPITVQVTDNGVPPLSDSETLSVTVAEVNLPPAITPVPEKLVVVGQQLKFQLSRTDPDIPAQDCAFSFADTPPSGATISTLGLFTWTPPLSHPAGTNVVKVRVTDNGIPSLSATQAFNVVVSRGLLIEVGDILLANNRGNSVFKINPQTGVQYPLGTFTAPTELALGTNGILYVSQVNGTVKRLDLTNSKITVVNTNTLLRSMWGLAVGPSGDLFATLETANSVVKINPVTGQETVLSQGNLLLGPYGIEVLDATHLLVASLYNNCLVSVSMVDGAQTLLVQEQGLGFPWGLAVSGNDIYVAANGTQEVQKFSGGVVSAVYFSELSSPIGLGIGVDGNLVCSAGGFGVNEILRLSPQGTLLGSFTGGLVGECTGIEIATERHVPPVPTNAPPVAAAPMLTRYAWGGTKLPVAEFTGTDADGDTVVLSALGPASAGGTVTLDGDWVFYSPPAGPAAGDSFTFTVSDGRGGQATGTARVQLKADNAQLPNLRTEPLGNGSVRLWFDGIPGRSYAVEYAEDLVNPVWVRLTTLTADLNGIFVFVDTPPGGAAPRFYHAVRP
jgi:streptogramin lyase